MEFSISCELPFCARDMWRIRACAAFRRHVVEDGLLKKLDSTASRPDKDGYLKRTQRYIPSKVDCPDFLRKIIGDAIFDVTDEQRWKEDPARFEQLFSIRPTHLSSFCCTEGSLVVANVTESSQRSNHAPSLSDDTDLDGVSSDESDSDDAVENDQVDNDGPLDTLFASLPPEERCVHTISGTTKVNLPGAGWAVERSIVHNLRLFYERYPICVGNFRKALYEKFANGDKSVSISVVVDRLLKHEEETESVSSDDVSESESNLASSIDGTLQSALDLGNGLRVPFAPPRNALRSGPPERTIEAEFEKFFV